MPKKTDLDPGFVARVAAGVRYAVQGVAPGDWFGPSQPSAPLAPPEVAGRQFDFPVGFNSGITPRSYEPVGFGSLRAMADGYDLMRLIIETRKDQIERLSFDVRRVDGGTDDPRIAQVRAFLKRPDRLHSWQQWLRMLLEDLLVIDAPAVYLRRANDGGMFAFEVIDGATIAPKIDQSGRVPLEGPAYQQVLKGVPAVDYSADELVYFPRNPRPNRVYGFGPVEQVLTTVTIALRRQVQQLNNFTDGNLPEAYATVPESWTADQIRQFQINFDGYMAGNSANKSKLYFLPHGVVPQTLRDNPLKDGFDDWLARIVCFAFSVSPQALQPAMNKASAEQASGEAMKEGLEPLQIWVRDFVNECILRGFGYDDIEFVWTEETAINPAAQAEINAAYLKAGVKTINEVRGEIGLPKVAEGDQLLVYGASGAVRLAEVVRKLDHGVALGKGG